MMKSLKSALRDVTARPRLAGRLAAIILAFGLALANSSAKDYVPNDYVWTSPSLNSAGSMPCGGHDVGMNVWVEDGDVMFYVARSGMFDENNTLLKAGRFRLSLASDPFRGDDGSFTADPETKRRGGVREGRRRRGAPLG